MVGDSYADDIEGARALGMRAILLDRDGLAPDEPDRIDDLRALPSALGLGVRRAGGCVAACAAPILSGPWLTAQSHRVQLHSSAPPETVKRQARRSAA